MRRLVSALGMAALFVLAASAPSMAESWEHLGTRKVDLRNDRDVIEVGRSEGRFRNLQVRVKGNDIFFKSLTVVFGNGSRQTINLDARVREGAVSSPIDLKGDARFIKKIVLDYKRIPNFRGDAFVSVYGRQHGAFVTPEKWELLGKREVNLFKVDHDRIGVGKDKGRFSKLQIRVSGNDVYFRDMTVVFGNGSSQKISVNENVREGTVSRPIDLKGDARFIESIHLEYKKKLKDVFRGKAFVSVYGR